jgi:hypothetical protein
MRTMNHTEKTIVKAYSVLFDNLSDVCKTALIEYLSETMKTSKKCRKQKTVLLYRLVNGKIPNKR